MLLTALARGRGRITSIMSPPMRTVASSAMHFSPLRVVLGIETSCDETAVSVVREDGTVLSEVVASQWDVHAEWGGVVPALAARAHEERLPGVLSRAVAESGLAGGIDDVDAVAVSTGPGLALCLKIGLLEAKRICASHRAQLLPVNHLEAHVLVARLHQLHEARALQEHGDAEHEQSGEDRDAAAARSPEFPFLTLLVSGGHCMLVLVRGVGVSDDDGNASDSDSMPNHLVLGTTLDDSVGEAYDKVARMLCLTNFDDAEHGGAAVERCAREHEDRYEACGRAVGTDTATSLGAVTNTGMAGSIAEHKEELDFEFAVPMQRRNDCHFSFSGLKTAVLRAVQRVAPADSGDQADRAGRVGAAWPQQRSAIAAAFQHAAVNHLQERTRRALAWCAEHAHKHDVGTVRDLVVCGGVAANVRVRSALAAVASDAGVRVVFPPPRWCVDNGTMVAWAGVEHLARKPEAEDTARAAAGADRADAGANDDAVDFRARWPLGPVVQGKLASFNFQAARAHKHKNNKPA